ncbi:hypothetical protein P154DRAFT_579038 [Amniculicola lignicola CBS 123094]|uniref:Uncharacterized protein n=1 Tax=Amniculicola lignicola CBS 123094 TaxID=1392246 RepID=A0A6A5WHZ8_9PLEO|nr:hypothetical protein P154DRAFT_579038 [Amniculicola lignicola CBS 123094]
MNQGSQQLPPHNPPSPTPSMTFTSAEIAKNSVSNGSADQKKDILVTTSGVGSSCQGAVGVTPGLRLHLHTGSSGPSPSATTSDSAPSTPTSPRYVPSELPPVLKYYPNGWIPKPGDIVRFKETEPWGTARMTVDFIDTHTMKGAKKNPDGSYTTFPDCYATGDFFTHAKARFGIVSLVYEDRGEATVLPMDDYREDRSMDKLCLNIRHVDDLCYVPKNLTVQEDLTLVVVTSGTWSGPKAQSVVVLNRPAQVRFDSRMEYMQARLTSYSISDLHVIKKKAEKLAECFYDRSRVNLGRYTFLGGVSTQPYFSHDSLVIASPAARLDGKLGWLIFAHHRCVQHENRLKEEFAAVTWSNPWMPVRANIQQDLYNAGLKRQALASNLQQHIIDYYFQHNPGSGYGYLVGASTSALNVSNPSTLQAYGSLNFNQPREHSEQAGNHHNDSLQPIDSPTSQPGDNGRTEVTWGNSKGSEGQE